jgi:hypothetical protein
VDIHQTYHIKRHMPRQTVYGTVTNCWIASLMNGQKSNNALR